jgi:Abnormal spindle-like microcephaly-assoc'd, ASPM-SPD-2-Hydin
MNPRAGGPELTRNARLTGSFGPLHTGPLAFVLSLVAITGVSGCAGLAGANNSTNGGAPQIVASPASVSFGDVSLGTTSSQTVTLQNNGKSSVTISTVSVTGVGFSTSGVGSGAILSPNQSATLTVSFDPSRVASDTGSISIASSATNSPLALSLSGTGVTPHTVALTWSASSSPDIVGYNIYRATGPGLYSQLNSSLVGPTSFTDSSVQSGQNITYYYVVTAVNSSGVESTDSNQATAVVP